MDSILDLDYQRYPSHKAMPKVQYYFRKIQSTPPEIQSLYGIK